MGAYFATSLIGTFVISVQASVHVLNSTFRRNDPDFYALGCWRFCVLGTRDFRFYALTLLHSKLMRRLRGML